MQHNAAFEGLTRTCKKRLRPERLAGISRDRCISQLTCTTLPHWSPREEHHPADFLWKVRRSSSNFRTHSRQMAAGWRRWRTLRPRPRAARRYQPARSRQHTGAGGASERCRRSRTRGGRVRLPLGDFQNKAAFARTLPAFTGVLSHAQFY